MQRDSKEVMAELVAKLSERLEQKPAPEKATERKPKSAPAPNRDRLTVGVDLGDRWSNYCILGQRNEFCSYRCETLFPIIALKHALRKLTSSSVAAGVSDTP